MSAMSLLLTQCLDMTKQLMKPNQQVTISIMIGSDFKFEFSNQDQSVIEQKKKQSPSKRRRNVQRKEDYDVAKKRNFNIVHSNEKVDN